MRAATVVTRFRRRCQRTVAARSHQVGDLDIDHVGLGEWFG